MDRVDSSSDGCRTNQGRSDDNVVACNCCNSDGASTRNAAIVTTLQFEMLLLLRHWHYGRNGAVVAATMALQ
jgi:hypothetical protein